MQWMWVDGREGIWSLKAEDGDGGTGGGEIIRPTGVRNLRGIYTHNMLSESLDVSLWRISLGKPEIGRGETSEV